MRSGVAALLATLILLSARPAGAGTHCEADRVAIIVLGSGGPELDDGRASSGYLFELDGVARVLIDAGSGTALNFERAGARLESLAAILLTHLHVDHSVDLPSFVKAAYFSDRDRDLPVLGPPGNALMPSLDAWLRTLFAAPDGAYRYLSEYLDPEAAAPFKLRPHTVDLPLPDTVDGPHRTYRHRLDGLALTATRVHHGPIPALAWRIEVAGCAVVFSGDTSNRLHGLDALARGADLLIAHNAVPEGATGTARALHMPPSEIGRIAQDGDVGRLLLSHRMRRTLGREAETVAAIRRHYPGSVVFAEDGARYPLR